MARKILLADDSVTAQNMGRKILADAGYDIVTVNNGSAALKRITEIKPDLIVLDVYMPGYSGLEVCQRIKDAPETAHIPVLLTVGKLEPFKPEEARRVRADAHIVKPFEASELLTAITKLEDRMVPQQSDRFSQSVSGVERFGGDAPARNAEGGDAEDTGWKSRLRFPKKKKEKEAEPEPEPEDVAGATFRDFRKGKGKTSSAVPFTVKAPAPPGQEPGLVPDIPRDITPDELDALSALAAKLDGPIPEAEDIAPLAEPMGSTTPQAAVDANAENAETSVETPAAVEMSEATEAEGSAPPVEPAAVAVVTPSATDGAATLAEASAESAAASKQVTDTPPVSEPAHAETPSFESPTGMATVNTATLSEPPAPIDQQDEPIFASASTAPASEGKTPPEIAAENPEHKAVEAVATSEVVGLQAAVAAVAASGVTADVNESKTAESKPQELQQKESKPDQSSSSEATPATVEPIAASARSAQEPEDPAPTDEELAEALRLLTPATGHAEANLPTHGTLIAAGQMLAEEAARHSTEYSRWVAEPVAMSADEAAISLEAEMFRTFATLSPAPQAPATEPSRPTGVPGITAAVENRLAALDLAQQKSAEARVDVTEPAPSAKVASASEPEKIAEEPAPLEGNREEAADEVASATFADAMSKEADASATTVNEAVNNSETSAVAAAEANQVSSSESEDQESMGKDGKAKSGKSTWHQIRTTPTAAASNDVVEAAKQGASEAEEAPKAMAAAAAADSSPSTASPDASTIASIVDSVMADLRPKIVEEIAKKLAGK